jgi:PKD domain
MTTGRPRLVTRLVALSLLAFFGSVGFAVAQPAPDSNSVLLLAKSVRNPATSVEATQAAALGYRVVVATDDQWAAMSSDQFATYKAVILGDGMCSGDTSLLAAEANPDVWGPAVTGNVIVMGTHPAVVAANSPGGVDLVRDGVRFAASGQGAGAYITPSCYMSATAVPVKVLQAFGTFTAARQNACPRVTHLLASDPDFTDLTDAGLSGWQCTADAGFVQWPSGFNVLAIATNADPGQYTASDGTAGSPFILMRQPVPSSPASPQLASTGSPFDPTASIPINLSGTRALGYSSGHDSFWGVYVGADVNASAKWEHQWSSNLSWNGDKLRQGENPGLTNTLDPGRGILTVSARGEAHLAGAIVPFDESVVGDCALNIDGSPYDCNIPAICVADLGSINADPLGELRVCLSIEAATTITPHDLTVDRAMLYSTGDKTGPDTLTFPPLTLDDGFKVSCYVPEGTEVVYQLTNPSTTPNIGLGIGIGLVVQGCGGCVPILGCLVCDTLGSVSLFSSSSIVSFDFPLTGTGGEASLGTVLKDDTPPNLQDVTVSYSGDEGSPITFSAAGTQDSCLDTVSFTWEFSDGGKAFGLSPQHIFADGPVTYSGQLRATDLAGNSQTKDLSVKVNNVPPVVKAGPNMAAAWGTSVSFNGAATDPGAADQSTLVYRWAFGDGTPSANGGPSVTHVYAAPGLYTATLTVCDKDGACSSNTCTVTVRKRTTVAGYLGDQNGVYDTVAMLKAALTDEYGQPVQGRNVTFAFSPGGETGSAATDSAGIAATTHLLGLSGGSYTVSASFAGDTLYQSAPTSTATYLVVPKPTSLTYTGSLTGGPNKAITLSAVLVDSQGKVLTSRLITFLLGSQSASATTDGNGVASTSLKLNQKNGTYQLTSTFTPGGADVGRYVGSGASNTFKLQAK